MSLFYEKYLNCFENCIRSVRGKCPATLRVIKMTSLWLRKTVFQALAVKMRRLGALSRWLCKCSNTGCVVSCAPTVMSAVGQGQLGNLPGLISKVWEWLNIAGEHSWHVEKTQQREAHIKRPCQSNKWDLTCFFYFIFILARGKAIKPSGPWWWVGRGILIISRCRLEV